MIKLLGVLDSIKIRKASFPIRRLYKKLYEKYEILTKEPFLKTLSKEEMNKIDYREKIKK